MSLWVNKSGQLMASGSWTKYPHIATHDGFAELAVFLGQNHRASASGRRVSDLDLERFWSVVLDCAQQINV